MNCSEVKELLHPYSDGELTPEETERIRLALDDCADCRAELDEIEAIRAFAMEAFTAPVAEVDLSSVYDGVMARIAAEEVQTAPAAAAIDGVRVQRETEEPGLIDRFGKWLSALITFDRPLVSMAAAAAIIAMVGGVWFVGQADSPTTGTTTAPQIAGADDDAATRGKRRGRLEESTVARGSASVESYEVADGRIVIEGGEDDAPVVVWHIEDEGAATDDPGL